MSKKICQAIGIPFPIDKYSFSENSGKRNVFSLEASNKLLKKTALPGTLRSCNQNYHEYSDLG